MAATFLFTGCGKDDDDAAKPSGKTYTPSVTATVNSEPWTGVQAGSNNVMGIFVFEASDSKGSTIKFMGSPIDSIGTYNFKGQYIVPTGGGNATLYTTDFGGTSEFVVTKLDRTDHRISGTFKIESEKYSGTGPDSVVITNGVYTDVLFQE